MNTFVVTSNMLNSEAFCYFKKNNVSYITSTVIPTIWGICLCFRLQHCSVQCVFREIILCGSMVVKLAKAALNGDRALWPQTQGRWTLERWAVDTRAVDISTLHAL